MQVGELWVKLGLDKSGFDNGINESKGQSSGLGGFIKGAFQFTVGQGMFDLIKTGIKSAWDTSIGFNSQIQQSQAAFTTLLGNGSKASEMLGKLSKMAADTPFELTDLTSASQTLLGFGIDSKNVMGDLNMLGDISMGNKERFNGLSLAFAQIQSAGKLTGQDLLQLISNGFNPLQTMSKQTGLSMAELKDKMSKGAISADMVTNAFKAATEKGGIFYGSMDKQSKTFEGQMSTLSDNVRSTLGGVMKPQFEYLSNTVLPLVINKVAKFGDAFKTGGLSAAMKTIIPAGLVDGLTSVGKAIEGAFGWIKNNGKLVKTLLSGILGGYLAFKTITGILKAVEGAQKLLNIVMEANPMMKIIIIIGALVGAFIYLWNTNEGFRNALIGAWDSIKGFFKGIPAFFSDIWTNVKNTAVATWNSVLNFFTGLPGRFVSIASGIGNAIKSGFDSAVSFIKGLPGEALQWGKDFINGLVNGIKQAAGAIGDAVNGIAQDIRKFLHFSVPDQGPLTDYESWMPDFIKGMAAGIDNNKSKLINSIKSLAGNMALSIQGSMPNGVVGALAGSSGGYNSANITVMLDGKVLARVLGQKLIDEIRVRTGIKL